MEAGPSNEEKEEEYVLLDLDAVSGQFDVPPNAPYVLSVCVCLLACKISELSSFGLLFADKRNCPDFDFRGLDTLNPVLIIDNKLKLIGEYEETIGTCLVFSEEEAAPVVHEETGLSEVNLFSGKRIIDPNQSPTKQVKPVAQLYKILKFKLLLDGNNQDAPVEEHTSNS